VFGIPWFKGKEGNNGIFGNDYSIGSAEISPGDIDEIQINWVSGNVDISYYDGTVIKFSEQYSGTLKDNQKLRYKIDSGRLTIDFAKRNDFFTIFDFGSAFSGSKDLEVSIPIDLKRLIINSTSAEVEIDGITADKLEINTVSGEVEMIAVSVPDSVNINTVSGDVNAVFKVFPRNFGSGAVSGDIDLKLPENTAFTVDFDSVSGDLNNTLPTSNGGDSHKINSNSVSGDLNIN
jgi:DUF4097 and DUF4098 domain-containing protein YvlB